jgi:hypothetical protein
MTRHEDDTVGVLASVRLLITFAIAGLASASAVGLVAIIDTWWIVAFAVLFLLCTTGGVVAVIIREIDRDEHLHRPARSARVHGGPWY